MIEKLRKLSLFLILGLADLSVAVAQTPVLSQGLAKVGQKDWQGAQEVVAPLGAVAVDLIEWHRLRAGEGTLTEYEAFLARRPDWPGLAQLRTRGEVAVARSITPSRILAWFDGRDATTADGLRAQMRALGTPEQIAPLLARVWPSISLDQAEQEAILAETQISVDLHQARLDHLLWVGRFTEARLMLPLVTPQWRALAEARIALREDREGVDALIEAVPAILAKDAGLAHARFEWRARKGRRDGAIEILQAASHSSEGLGRPSAWAGRRATIARALLREGQAPLAYDLASNHHLTSGGHWADLEFLAGFIALRHLNEPAKALTHFQAISANVSTGISISRGDYWQARALQTLGRAEEAKAMFARAAQHQTAYYGLLAAEALGQPLDPALAQPKALPDWRQSAFLKSSVTEAALLAYQAQEVGLARRFLLHLAEGLQGAELEALGAFALAKGDAHLAVLVGKQAAARGIILPAIYYPDPEGLLPQDLAVPRPLALSIARRESEFRIDARSGVGALGLMQLMPGTAKMMADKLGVADRQAALAYDPAYNAQLGSAYLAHLAEEFGPSIALRAAGYNAGPGRPRAWIKDLGDPRQPDVDVVDWVEMVPFTETRTYIMRVAEGVVLYAARGKPDAKITLTALLRGDLAP